MPVEHFASKNAYRRWNAYRHMHGIPAPNLGAVIIGGKRHTVKHSVLSQKKRAKAFGG
jgi:hypothetical protein